ncbi:C-type lectin domain family 2 member D-like isoform X2 [Hemicordylus capensis]|uniref:C-type lectin domain family 2 member D-like isoform X2 n=1 Tax=Hemicordylus capensis TaxID=884348 RepID=UPI002303EFA6|nr:C-type lectin domain family 2 member D-like isoform X2 [Hemicordylus capensis]
MEARDTAVVETLQEEEKGEIEAPERTERWWCLLPRRKHSDPGPHGLPAARASRRKGAMPWSQLYFCSKICSSLRNLHIIICILLLLIIIIIIIIIFLIVTRQPASSKTTDDVCPHMDVPVLYGPACPTDWIGYERNCYFFSEEERNWTFGQSFCSSLGSFLAVIESEPEKVFILRYKGKADHWIGLKKDSNQAWKWADGTEFNNTLEVQGGGGDCAFLSTDIAIASLCHIPRNWICSQPDAYARNKNTTGRE